MCIVDTFNYGFWTIPNVAKFLEEQALFAELSWEGEKKEKKNKHVVHEGELDFAV